MGGAVGGVVFQNQKKNLQGSRNVTDQAGELARDVAALVETIFSHGREWAEAGVADSRRDCGSYRFCRGAMLILRNGFTGIVEVGRKIQPLGAYGSLSRD